MKPSFSDYVREAFHARPIGMFVPPNWVGLGVFGLLGLLNPGFWVMGVGLELAYLGILATNKRFQRLIDALYLGKTTRTRQEMVNDLVSQLGPEGLKRYRALEVRCRAILEQQFRGGPDPDGSGDSGGRTEPPALGLPAAAADQAGNRENRPRNLGSPRRLRPAR